MPCAPNQLDPLDDRPFKCLLEPQLVSRSAVTSVVHCTRSTRFTVGSNDGRCDTEWPGSLTTAEVRAWFTRSLADHSCRSMLAGIDLWLLLVVDMARHKWLRGECRAATFTASAITPLPNWCGDDSSHAFSCSTETRRRSGEDEKRRTWSNVIVCAWPSQLHCTTDAHHLQPSSN